MDLLVSNVHVTKFGGGGWVEFMWRRDASSVPPLDKILKAPFGREAEYKLICKRLREGRDKKVLKPGIPGGGAHVGR